MIFKEGCDFVELRNWRLYFSPTYDMAKYHAIIGGLSDFLVDSKPDDVFEIKNECNMVGNVYGHRAFKDGDPVKTSPVFDITRLAIDDSNPYDFIVRTQKSEYFLKISNIDKKFYNEAWTFGTPGKNPQ